MTTLEPGHFKHTVRYCTYGGVVYRVSPDGRIPGIATREELDKLGQPLNIIPELDLTLAKWPQDQYKLYISKPAQDKPPSLSRLLVPIALLSLASGGIAGWIFNSLSIPFALASSPFFALGLTAVLSSAIIYLLSKNNDFFDYFGNKGLPLSHAKKGNAIGFGTSLPEVTASGLLAGTGSSLAAQVNAAGSNLFNPIILWGTHLRDSWIMRKQRGEFRAMLRTKSEDIKKGARYLLYTTLLLGISALTPIGFGLHSAILALFILWGFIKPDKKLSLEAVRQNAEKHAQNGAKWGWDTGKTIMAGAGLVGGAKGLVNTAENGIKLAVRSPVAQQSLIGGIGAVGTSLPELFVIGKDNANAREFELAGDITGAAELRDKGVATILSSNVFNATAVANVAAVAGYMGWSLVTQGLGANALYFSINAAVWSNAALLIGAGLIGAFAVLTSWSLLNLGTKGGLKKFGVDFRNDMKHIISPFSKAKDSQAPGNQLDFE